ncbi:MAG: hypothetical protein AABW80_00355 [Nanoarchaeota archaeon]
MIVSSKQLSIAEVREYTKDIDSSKPIAGYIKKFAKLEKDEAEKLAGELRKLDNLKIKEYHIAKVIDFMPKDSEDVNKIFADVSLSEEEANSIIEIVKRY